MKWRYTNTKVDHLDRKKMGISINEYCVYDLIRSSLNRLSCRDISKKLGLSISTVSIILNRLSNKGYLDIVTIADDEAMAELDKNYRHGCLSCGSKDRLHEHHYPIRKKDGGKQTVTLCFHCHSKFHEMTDYGIYKIIL